MNKKTQTIIEKDIPIEPISVLPPGVLFAYEHDKLVVFIGAGISRVAGCLGWEDMSNELIDATCNASTAEQIKNSDLDSKAKITIAKRLAINNPKLERVFWDIFSDAITAKKDTRILRV